MKHDQEIIDVWGEGPWLTEPLYEPQNFEYKGYTIWLNRGPSGAWNGYIGVPLDSHYAQDENYDELDVHGGVTWNGPDLPFSNDDKNTQSFWIGFDCGHWNDYQPIYEQFFKKECRHPSPFHIKIEEFKSLYPKLYDKTYKTMDFAREQCEKMVDQIIEKAK